MTGNLISHETAHLALAALMAVCLALTIVTFPLALIWIRQPIGSAAMDISDASATGFSLAFLAAFVLAAMRQRSHGLKKVTAR